MNTQKPTGRPAILTAEQVRKFDRIAIEQFGIPSIVLMENAARGATDALCRFARCSERETAPDEVDAANPTAILICGRGNNGGDGLVMARHLHLRGWNTHTILLANPESLSPDSTTNYRILRQTEVPIAILDLAEAESNLAISQFRNLLQTLISDGCSDSIWLIDAILGTGAKLPLRPPLGQLIQIANEQTARKMVIDVPTGLDCDSTNQWEEQGGDQQGDPVFKAELTVSFVASKPAMETPAGIRHCGTIKIVDIGAPPEIFDLL